MMIRTGWRVRGGLGWLLAANVLACGTSEPTKQPARPTSEALTQPGTPPTPSKSETPNPPELPEPPEPPEVADAAASSINAVAIDLHRALADRPGDLFISPASIAIAFAMVHAGARAATEEELARVFHLGKDGAKAREALAATLATGRVHYWSRSRGRLWRKGESSGHVQQVEEIRLDCDADAILVLVRQVGGIACHTGRESCFFQRLADGRWTTTDPVLKDPAAIYGHE